MAGRSITDLDLNGKKVLIRVDFNVPIKNGTITDDTRIRASLPTIEYALGHGAATVILSGLSVGFESAVYTTLVIGSAVFGAFLLGGATLTVSLFAVALAGCGLLTTVGVILCVFGARKFAR